MIFCLPLYSISSSPGSPGSALWLSGHAVPRCHHEHCGGKEEGCHIHVSDVIKLLKLFSVMSELSEMFWRDQMWWSCRGRVRRRCAWPLWEG